MPNYEAPRNANFFLNTDYYGASVDNSIAEQLKTQPVAEILRFEEKNGKTVLQTRSPEKGAFGNPPRSYDIRVNMNYFMRGLAKYVKTPEGGIDPVKVMELDNWRNDMLFADKVDLDGMMDKFDIPRERRDNFKLFLEANGVSANNTNSLLFSSSEPLLLVSKETFHQLIPYQLAVSGGQDTVLSLETTAPPDGGLFHRRGAERTGVGIYPNEEAVKQYHLANNVRHMDVRRGIPSRQEKDLLNTLKRKGDDLGKEPQKGPRVAPPKKSYLGYLQAHTGPRAGQMNQTRLIEEASKAIAAQYFLTDPKSPPFSVKTARKFAENLRKSPQFLAVLDHMGTDSVRAALISGTVTNLTEKLYADPDKRYKLDAASKTQLLELGRSMDTKGRSAAWTQLKRALTDPNMTNSADIIAAVEQYTKGKKSVRFHRSGRDAFDLSMKALAIASRGAYAKVIAFARSLLI